MAAKGAQLTQKKLSVLYPQLQHMKNLCHAHTKGGHTFMAAEGTQ